MDTIKVAAQRLMLGAFGSTTRVVVTVVTLAVVVPLALGAAVTMVLWILVGAALVLGGEASFRPRRAEPASEELETTASGSSDTSCDNLVLQLHVARHVAVESRVGSHLGSMNEANLTMERVFWELRRRQRERHCDLCQNLSPSFLYTSWP